MKALIALLSGTIFGYGLSLGGMTDPANVKAFLDLAGDWDPALAFVMGGALLVTTPAYKILFKRERPLLEKQFFLPTRFELDKDLLAGAAIFGIGWGVGGFCPGPAIADIATAMPQMFLFIGAMMVGMWLCDRWVIRRMRAQHRAKVSTSASSAAEVPQQP